MTGMQEVGAILQQASIKQQSIRPAVSDRTCKCGGQGWYSIFDPEANMGAGAYRTKVCICRKIARAKIGEIPAEFNGKRFDDVTVYQKGWSADPTDLGNVLAVGIAKEFVENFETHLQTQTGPFFIGKPGRGKTMICSIIFQELCKQNYYPIYLHFRRFLDKLIESYQRQDEGLLEKDYFEVIQEANVVIIDELRTTKNKFGQINDWQQDKILKILDLAKVVVIDSNYDLAWISENIGEHIASRISARCGLPVIVGGPDHRAIIGRELQNQILERVKEAV